MSKGKLMPICKRNPNEPKSYVAWHEWASKMSETHINEKCDICSKFHVWVKRCKKLMEKKK